MSGRVRAAGAVVFHNFDGIEHVALVHRQAYDDWTIPKGKAHPDELRPVTAVREVREETGLLINLGTRLSSLTYPVGKHKKKVDYWRAEARARFFHVPDKEVDEVRWVPVDDAPAMLSYPTDVKVLEEALALPPTTALLLVRHAKAMLRKHWSGNDQSRRLDGRGRRQAAELIPLFEAFGVRHLVSSPAVRCAETLAPYGRYKDIRTETITLLTEEEGTNDPDGVAARVRDVAAAATEPTALCGHRPVLPAMQEGLGLKHRSMLVGEITVLHRDSRGNIVAEEHHKSTA
ncbi:NUDIX domain-containing protein [uncultured Tessaracoccus sp.]|uniref:NUDIX hydrolase n=1 Tax=uncultured Tessaracoccus sp. TaxID=905023 RepID=UPI002612F1EB|nr:NUDIX domain-containing protein [uncultured Tessaracoccus sp.]